MPPKLQYRRLRAPEQDGELLVDPTIGQVENLLERNQQRLREMEGGLHGKSWHSLRSEARDELVSRACAHTRAYRDVQPGETGCPIVLTGHQPQLFHPGVWSKNFALHQFAQLCDAIAVNLIIDNDLCRSTSLRVPTGQLAKPHVQLVPFDQAHRPLPYEERTIRDRSCFDSFGQRLASAVTSLLPSPLGSRIWPWAVEAARRESRLGVCVAEARHRLEATWGLDTLEVPLSQICETNSFRWFAMHLLAELPGFHRLYNDVLEEYRKLHAVRSPAHPLPNLGGKAGWLETPFWIWTSASPDRRPLYVRRGQGQLHLSDGKNAEWSLQHRGAGLDEGVEQLEKLARHGLRLRPRALITTMFARLFLGDVFIHGIGGAKYDQITDQLIERHFGVLPPEFVTLSATLRLPLEVPRIGATDIIQLTQLLRDIRFHPERHLKNGDAKLAQVSRWIKEKKSWIHAELPQGRRRERHIGITRSNEALQHFVHEKAGKTRTRRAELARQAAAAKILGSREWSFCLFPEDDLRRRLLELLGVPA